MDVRVTGAVVHGAARRVLTQSAGDGHDRSLAAEAVAQLRDVGA